MKNKILLTLTITILNLFFSNSVKAQYNISTYAGSFGAYNGDGGPAQTANLKSPTNLCFDTIGNLYISDYLNHAIRKITPSGIISTIAGNGTGGYTGDGGLATNALLYYPYGIAIDKFQNVYFSEQGNNLVRKIDGAGIITTVAGVYGNGSYNGDGIPANTAYLFNPGSITCDTLGNLYIADQYNFRIRKVDLLGMISTVAGDGSSVGGGDGGLAINASFSYLTGLACDKFGNLYTSEFYRYKVRKIDAQTGIIDSYAGNGASGMYGDGGQATLAALNQPAGLTIDSLGNLYIADATNNVIRKVNSSGIISTIAGNGIAGFSGDGAIALSAKLNNPYGCAINKKGHIYIADKDNNRIRLLLKTGKALDFAGSNCRTPSFSFLTSNLTVEARVKWDGSAGGVIFNNGQFSLTGYAIWLELGNSNNIGLLIGSVVLSSSAHLTPGTWQTISVVNDAGVWSLYLDGVPYALTNNTAGASPISASNYFILGSDNAGTSNFGGAYDELRYWNRPLCETEIQSRINCSPASNSPGLLAFYNFNQGNAEESNNILATLADSSGNGHNLALNNFILNGPTSNWVAPPGTLNTSCTPFIAATPTVSVSGPTTFCNGGSVVLTSSPGASYLWSNGQTTQSITVTTSQIDSVQVTNPGGCYGILHSAPTNVNVAVAPVPSICMVATDSATNFNYNFIYWDKTGYTNVDSFIFYRYDVVTVDYLRIGAVSKDSLSIFKDTSFAIGGPNGGNPQYGSWQYKMAIRDTCGNISKLSNYHQTTFLQQSGSNFSWTPYVDSGFVHPPTGYSFLRDDNNTGVFHALANIAGTASSDPNYGNFPNANWRVDPLGFNCVPTLRLGNNSTQTQVVKSKSNVRNNRVIGIQQLDKSGINIFPNPSNGIFNLSISNSLNLKTTSVEIYNVLGEKVFSSSIKTQNSQLNISNLFDGIYQLRLLENESLIYQTKIIKQ